MRNLKWFRSPCFWKDLGLRHSLQSCLPFAKLKEKKNLEANVSSCQSQKIGKQVFLLFSVAFHLKSDSHQRAIVKTSSPLPRSNTWFQEWHHSQRPAPGQQSARLSGSQGRGAVPCQTRGHSHHCCCRPLPSAEAPSLCALHSPLSSWQWLNQWTCLWGQSRRSGVRGLFHSLFQHPHPQ